MALMFDARILVVFGTRSDARDGDFVLDDGLSGMIGHDAGCSCCASRTPAAETLGRLFLQRVRGEVAFFRRVLMVGDNVAEQAIRAAVQTDPVASARFRLREGLRRR